MKRARVAVAALALANLAFFSTAPDPVVADNMLFDTRACLYTTGTEQCSEWFQETCKTVAECERSQT